MGEPSCCTSPSDLGLGHHKADFDAASVDPRRDKFDLPVKCNVVALHNSLGSSTAARSRMLSTARYKLLPTLLATKYTCPSITFNTLFLSHLSRVFSQLDLLIVEPESVQLQRWILIWAIVKIVETNLKGKHLRVKTPQFFSLDLVEFIYIV